MARVITAVAAILGLTSHVMIAVAIATNYWLIFRDRLPSGAPPTPALGFVPPHPLNPVLNDTGLVDLVVRFRADHLGVWVACFKELDYGGKVSCGFIDRDCRAKVCWVRNNGTERACTMSPVVALAGKCTAFQATRGMAVVGTFLSIVGTTFLFVSVCVMVRLFGLVGSFCTLIGALSLMVSFAVFIGAIFNAGGLNPVAQAGFSFSLLTASWVVGVFAALLGCIGAARAAGKDDVDYESD